LKLCRQFYSTYPNILGSATQEFSLQLSHLFINNFPETNGNPLPPKIRQLVTDELQVVLNKNITIRQSATDELARNDNSYLVSLLKTTSFTHFAELVQIDDPVKRKFYELLILKTTPTVKELKRQIETLAFERLGLSADKNIALAQLESKILPAIPADAVKSHYFFDFLDLKNPQLVEETELEQALITHLQEFIIELGHGF
jgi:predicted nuclease of restriction endonuclease-like (RecB) superfamily